MKRLREGFSATATELLCSPPKSLETRDFGAKGATIKDEIKKSVFTAQTVAAVDTFYCSQHLISL